MEIREMTLTEGAYAVSYLENGTSRRVRLQHAASMAEFDASLAEAAWHLAVWSRIVNAALQLEKVRVTEDVPRADQSEPRVSEPARAELTRSAPAPDWREQIDRMDGEAQIAWAQEVLRSEATYLPGVREKALEVLSA